MRRRDFIKVIAVSAAGWPLAARAAQPTRLVGMLLPYPEGDADGQTYLLAFQKRLQELGWAEGHNVRFDIRWAGGDPDIARRFAKELISVTPDVIVPSSNQITAILQQETRTIPIVFVSVGDPVASGFVTSMAHPGGNLTGFAVSDNAIGGKWVETLNEIAPQVSRVGFILHPETQVNVGVLRAAEAAPPPGLKVIALGVHNTVEVERTIATFAAEPNGGLIVAPHAITFANRDVIIELARAITFPPFILFVASPQLAA
jgi:ABC-type uncharacterized transport system substrate-binding protein